MATISKETAGRIWTCYHEIEMGTKLIKDMSESIERGEDPNPRDTWGRRRCLQLGVPSGESAHRLLDVQPKLALSIIRAHLADKQRELVESFEQARIELGEAANA
jgi:hypothetical protein